MDFNESNDSISSKNQMKISIKRQYTRRFREQWKNVFDWVEERKNAAYCIVCEKQLTSNLAHLRQHDGNNKHRKNSLEYKLQLSALQKKNNIKKKSPPRSSPARIMKCIKDEVQQLEILTADFNHAEEFLDDPLAQRTKLSKVNNTVKKPLVNKSMPTYSIKKADEFSYFGLNMAAQLRNMPLSNALRLQANFQDILTKERIKISENSSEK